MDFQISPQYLNSFGFIDYKDDGSLPWKNRDVVLSEEYASVTDILGIDCEMVGVGSFKMSVLGRVSIVNEYGVCFYDTFVKPSEEITDFCTEYSGIRPENLINAPHTDKVVAQVKSIVKGKILVGHAIHHDFEVLKLNHPIADIRDTANFFQYRDGNKRTPSLKNLIKEYFKTNIQTGEHSSIQDAQAALKLYLLFREEWEKDALERRCKANLADTVTDITCMHVQPRPPDLFAESKSVFIRPNKLVGAYSSSEEYLDIQFRLLMEDVLRPIRQDIRLIKQSKQLDNHFKNIRISMGSTSDGTTFEVKSFKTLRVPIQQNGLDEVDWDNRNVFLSGSLVILSPDNFQSAKCAKVIDVAMDERNDDAYFLRVFVNFLLDGPNWAVTNKQRFQMIESKAFFLPYEYTLNFLQVVDLDSFPMKKYIVDAVTKSEIAPNLVKDSIHQIDFSVLMHKNINACARAHPLDFQNWPTANQLNLDPSQYEALRRAMTQELTIIQGPPGTGKTHISLQIVKLILSNKWLNTTPILIVSYTNHALDQLLEPVLKFLTDTIHGGNRKIAEQSLLRIGGGCESDILLPCTMKFKREKLQEKNKINKQIKVLEKALTKVKNLDFSSKLIHRGILNFQLLPQFMLAKVATNEKSKYILNVWTKCRKEIEKDVLMWFGLNESSIELKPKSMTSIDDGLFLLLCKCNNLEIILKKKMPNIPKTLKKLQSSSLFNKNLEHQYLTRWGYYLFLVGQLAKVVETSRQELIAARDTSKKLEYYVKENLTLKQANIIGMTTTGAVKYKKILEKKLKPNIMLVEEAAHVLEAYVVASLTHHCTQLILIGDHMQLRPLIADYDLTKEFLDVSLMERLVKNGIDQKTQNWTQLKVQHRMRTEIAKLLCPVIYNELENHSDVEKYPGVKGCSKNLFFIHHENAESLEVRSRSCFNVYEAKYIVGLLSYFVSCGYFQSQITVICTYMAQKTLIDRSIKDSSAINEIEICTVDGFQGKQNDIIILSLVRNNKNNNVGFLKMVNRVCVALSRARHGLFMIGNMSILATSSDIWLNIHHILSDTNSIGTDLPLLHPRMFQPSKTLDISAHSQSKRRSTRTRARRRGGKNKGSLEQGQKIQNTCQTPFSSKQYKNTEKQVLPCGHVKSKIEVDDSKCNELSDKQLKCGHKIRAPCYQSSNSLECQLNTTIKLPCGHQKVVPCGKTSVKNVSCVIGVTRKLGCGHPVTVPCGADLSKVKCNAKKIKNLSCGHTAHIQCNQARKSIKCGFVVKKNMSCGHIIYVACHKVSSTFECVAKVTKAFSCGHTNTVPCHQVKCFQTVLFKYPCGHKHRFKCADLLKKPKKCCSMISKILPCGHAQEITCHQNPHNIDCKHLVMNSLNKMIECYKFMEKRNLFTTANNILSAMHQLKLND